jgi:hypothetical protein
MRTEIVTVLAGVGCAVARNRRGRCPIATMRPTASLRLRIPPVASAADLV